MARLLPLLLLLIPADGQDSWWNADWSHRRKITVANRYEDGPLPAGFQVRVPVDPAYLKMRARDDLADLAVTHAGTRIPAFTERSGGRCFVWFRARKDIPAGGKDTQYALYFGNPSAGTATEAAKVFDFHEDFSAEKTDTVSIDPALKTVVNAGSLTVRDVPTDRPGESPAGITLKNLPDLSSFALRVTLRLDPEEGTACSAGVRVRMGEKKEAGKDLAKRIRDLVAKLGSPDWVARDTATEALIEIGRPSEPFLEEAAKSDDAEVKWRADRILREIRERAPSRTIRAEIRATGSSPPGQRSHCIFRTSGSYPVH
ncbi:MAG: DUF2341 domain-containing protein, partial [Planctomycetota bacterium]